MRPSYTKHARDVMEEREIPEEWVLRVLREPAEVEYAADGTTHHLAAIREFEGRILRVVTAGESETLRVITVFFDRRLGRTLT